MIEVRYSCHIRDRLLAMVHAEEIPESQEAWFRFVLCNMQNILENVS
jgi:hypothetical protein